MQKELMNSSAMLAAGSYADSDRVVCLIMKDVAMLIEATISVGAASMTKTSRQLVTKQMTKAEMELATAVRVAEALAVMAS